MAACLLFYVWRIVPYPPFRIKPLRYSVIHLTENVQRSSAVAVLILSFPVHS